MIKHDPVLIGCLAIIGILLVLLGFTIYWDATIPQVDVIYVTSVTYDEWRGATWVYSYDRRITFRGIHKEIEAGKTYQFMYVARLPWAKLISVDTHEKRSKQ